MLVHIFTRMGKCHCVDITGLMVLSEKTFYMDCCDSICKTIECEAPCNIHLIDAGREIVLCDCTIKDKTIHYATKHIIGRSNK